jgi:hypothetical protein
MDLLMWQDGGGGHWFPFALIWVGLGVLVTWLVMRRRRPSGPDGQSGS